MERVVSLIDQYVRPSPDLIKADVAGGNLSLSLLGGDAIQLQFKNFIKSGDALTLTIDNAANAIRQLKVNTFLDEPSETVTLAVDFQTLPDGTNYAANKNLNVAAKEIVINVADSNYQKLAK